MKKQLNLRLESEDLELLESKCKDLGMDKTTFLTLAIRKGNATFCYTENGGNDKNATLCYTKGGEIEKDATDCYTVTQSVSKKGTIDSLREKIKQIEGKDDIEAEQTRVSMLEPAEALREAEWIFASKYGCEVESLSKQQVDFIKGKMYNILDGSYELK